MIDFGPTAKLRSVVDIRAAFRPPPKVKPSPVANLAAIEFRQSLGLSQRGMDLRFGLANAHWNKVELGKQSVPAAVRPVMNEQGSVV
jgi:hypothetical protein